MVNVAGPGKEVSEKSLELNVCAELLQHVRSWPGCEKALWFGLTQAQERRKGLDELIRNVGPGVSLMLQFKAPWPTSRVDDLYKFSINERQHEALEQLAGQRPKAVQYVFPLYSKWSKADRYAPDLAQDTWLVLFTLRRASKYCSYKAGIAELVIAREKTCLLVYIPRVHATFQGSNRLHPEADSPVVVSTRSIEQLAGQRPGRAVCTFPALQ